MTLCIVDVQPYFEAVNDDLVAAVLREMRAAKRRREGIVVLEYEDCGLTDERILTELRRYDRQTVLSKNEDCGTNQLMAAIQSLGFWQRDLKFCGVNACYCVWDTFWETRVCLEKDARVSLLSDAVNCSCSMSEDNPKHCIDMYKEHIREKKYKNVRIL